jgi:hypothetical protein
VRRAVVLAAALAIAAPVAQADVRRNLHDQRYCEILEAKGTPANAIVTVWNTIGFSLCPPAWWDSLDGGAIAEERGDLVVLLNGPRHWLVDVAEGNALGVETFSGEKLHKLATIPLRGPGALTQRRYFDRTIKRRNVFTWKKGRRVFELVAPGGDTYVMQSYAQIVDGSLTLADLPGLGSRLDLPDGWTYRTRVLGRPLVLRATGSATVVQDDLQNTYQLAKAPRRNAHPARRKLSIDGRTHSVPTDGPAGTVRDVGTLTGTPFGKGTMRLDGTLADGRLEGTFRLLFKTGSVFGTVSAPYTVTGNEIDFAGTARLIGGTGAFRGIRSGALALHDHNTLDGQNGVLEVSGAATY